MMRLKTCLSNNAGFTLIEIIATLVIVSVLSAVAVQKYDYVTEAANLRALDDGLSVLNSRELLTWTLAKMSDQGYQSDAILFSQLDTNLGADYRWYEGPNLTGGMIQLRDLSLKLDRTASTATSSGRWKPD